MMKPSTQDKTEGAIHEVKGKIKEEIGKATKNPNLEGQGKGEKIAGKIQNRVGRVEQALGE
ncbi:MAG TPA: CsbD family protein [Terriglobales bacterium]|nr:CsbD family protein [Terriglobales bacterium]